MLISKWFVSGAIVTGLALSSLCANAATAEAQNILETGSICNQAKQFRFFLQQMAISDGNTNGWPYADSTAPKECLAVMGSATAKADAARASLPAVPAGSARVAPANS